MSSRQHFGSGDFAWFRDPLCVVVYLGDYSSSRILSRQTWLHQDAVQLGWSVCSDPCVLTPSKWRQFASTYDAEYDQVNNILSVIFLSFSVNSKDPHFGCSNSSNPKDIVYFEFLYNSNLLLEFYCTLATSAFGI